MIASPPMIRLGHNGLWRMLLVRLNGKTYKLGWWMK
jgi:hypothetical protein